MNDPSRPRAPHPPWIRSRCQLWALLLVALFSGACGARAESTDTGNPPVVDERQIEIRATPRGVTVEAGAGAVSPGGATVIVTNLDTETTAATTAAADGSFELELEGGPADRYEVEVRLGERSSAVLLGAGGSDPSNSPTLQCLDSPSDAPGGATRGPEVCRVLHGEARCRAGEIADAADRACASDTDCVKVFARAACTDSCYGSIAVSQSAAASLTNSIIQVNDELCTEFDAHGCNYLPSGCPPLSPWHAGCVEGTCQAVFGCERGLEQAAGVVAAAAELLSAGCESDADCSTVFAPTCSWRCPSEPLFLTTSQLDALETLRDAVEATCQDAIIGEACPEQPCTTADPAQQAVCRAGACVDAASATPL